MAVVHRIEFQDQIGVYTVSSQTSLGMGEVSKFKARSNDVAAVHWVPGGTHIITLDSPLSYKFCAYTPMGECLVQYEAYQHALGIRCLGLSRPAALPLPLPPAPTPASASSLAVGVDCKFLALGSFDGKVRLVSAHSWQLAFVLPLVHPRELEAGFNGQALRLTVECAASQGAPIVREGEEAGAEGEAGDENATAQEGDAAAGAVVVKQRQVPEHVQALRCGAIRAVRKGFVGLVTDEEDAAAEAALSVRGQEGSAAASFFALRHLASLPRTQAHAPADGKRTLSSTSAAGKTATKKPSASATPAAAPVTTSAVSASTGFPAVGVSWLGWSGSNSLLAAREEAHPRCLWVWRPLSAQLLAVVVMLEPITCARWRPRAPSVAGPESGLPPPPPGTSAAAATAEEADVLAICTGTDRVYFWTAHSGMTFAETSAGTGHEGQYPGSSSAGIEASRRHFTAVSLRWSQDGAGLVLRGKEAHCVCQVSVPSALRRSTLPVR